MNGADLLCESLSARGVECAFGLPGTQTIPLYEAVRRSALRSVVTTNELAGAFMANGYYRASGRLAALLTIPGPGFTYALPGLAEARHDSAAILHVVVRPPTGERAFQFQALDQRRMVEGIVKGAVGIEQSGQIPDAVAHACDLALGGEPGPVMLECAATALEEPARPTPVRGASAELTLGPDAVAAAVEQLAAARRPLLMAGQGCAGASASLRELAELLSAPVVTTLSGRGVLPEDHELALGFEYERGDVADLNELIRECDAVLVLGCKLTAAGSALFELKLPAERLIQVDTSRECLGATYPARLAIASSVERFLERLLPALRHRGASVESWPPEQVARWRHRLRSLAASATAEPIFHGVEPGTAAGFFAILRQVLPRDAIVVTDSGLHQTLARRHLEILSPRGLLAPSDFQSMGFGLPAAIGAKLAAPERAVVAVIGDGGCAFCGMELLTALRERVPLTLVVLNDGYLNRIRLQQLAQYGRAEGCDVQNPDFDGLATALGASYALIDGQAEVSLRGALASPGPTLVEVRLGDSPSIRAKRALGLARGLARRVLPTGVARSLRRGLRR